MARWVCVRHCSQSEETCYFRGRVAFLCLRPDVELGRPRNISISSSSLPLTITIHNEHQRWSQTTLSSIPSYHKASYRAHSDPATPTATAQPSHCRPSQALPIIITITYTAHRLPNPPPLHLSAPKFRTGTTASSHRPLLILVDEFASLRNRRPQSRTALLPIDLHLQEVLRTE